MDDESLGWVALAIIGLLIWGGVKLFSGNENIPSYYSPSYTADCSTLIPENPYSYGSGHYAGFEWAENNGGGYCDGNSNSFNEGCEDYLTQEESYEMCLSR